VKTYDLAGLKSLLPEYLRALGVEVSGKSEKGFKIPCPIHHGTKRNFHGTRNANGAWVWVCYSGCGRDGGTVLDLHARLHGHPTVDAQVIAEVAGVLNVPPADGAIPTRNRSRDHHRRREVEQRTIAEERRRVLTEKLMAQRRELLTPYLCTDWRADFFHESPCRLEASHSAQTRQLIEWLFPPDAFVWMGEPHHSGKPAHRDHFRSARDWLAASSLPPRLSAGTFREGSFSRSQTNLASEPYLIIESDDLIGHKPTTENERAENRTLNAALMLFLVDRFGLELRALIDTGGKSLHGWFAHPGEKTAQALAELLDGLAIDDSVFTRSSSLPLRAPGCLHQDTGTRACLVYLNPIF
jgi:hypothetical protein